VLHKLFSLLLGFHILVLLFMMGLLLGASGCVLLDSCAAKEGTAEVAILSQPKGGNWVQTVSCTVEAKIGDLLNPVDITAEWMTSSGSHAKEVWRINIVSSQRTTSFSAPQGKFLDKTFWLRISWIDSNGKHAVESEKAACLTP
jgi:hypothetical protein